MENNYPNGWKDGWSSADHAEESYSPQAWEDALRRAKQEKTEIKKPVYKEPTLTEYEKEQIEREQKEKDFQEGLNRRKAVNIIVGQKHDNYYNKSLLKRASLALKGKSFKRTKEQIRKEAQDRVAEMSAWEVERFLEVNTKQEGRTR